VQEGESPESWQSMMEGLSLLCLGLASAAGGGAWEGELPVFAPADLCDLHDAAGLPAGRAAALRIAAAMPECAAAVALRQRWESTDNRTAVVSSICLEAVGWILLYISVGCGGSQHLHRIDGCPSRV